MTSESRVKAVKVSKEEYDIVSNRLAVALAKRESLIKSWTASSSRTQPPTKSQEALNAEDIALFRNEPAYLGVGAPIPSHYLVSEAERNNKSLRAKFFPTKGLKASKARDAEEKAASAKRGLNDESSDEEEGRSGLGRAKKLKRKASAPEHVKNFWDVGSEEVEESRSRLGKPKRVETKTSAERPVKNVANIGSGDELQKDSGLGRATKVKTKANIGEPVRQIVTSTALGKGNLGRKERDNSNEVDKAVTSTDRVVEIAGGITGMDAKQRKKMRKREKKRKLRAEGLISSG